MIPYSLRPRPAPDCWPMPYHRNMAEVARDEAKSATAIANRSRRREK